MRLGASSGRRTPVSVSPVEARMAPLWPKATVPLKITFDRVDRSLSMLLAKVPSNPNRGWFETIQCVKQ